MTIVRAKDIKMVKLSEIKLDPRNRNKHPKDQIDRLAKIIEYQGFRDPVTISNLSGYLKAGEGRYLAAKKLKLKEIPATYQDFDSDEQETAFGISHNAIHNWAELDLSGINADVPDLGPDFDIDLLGIKNFAIDVSDKEPGCDEDEVPEQVEPKTKLGDVYKLGNHRIMCGDATSVDALEKLMNGDKAEMVFTDPPYRMEAEGGSNQFVGKAARKLGESIKHLCEFDPVGFLNVLPTLFNEKIMNAYIFCNKDLVPDYLNFARECGYSFNILFWKKPNAIPLGGSHRPDVEYLILFRKSATWNNGLKDINYSRCLEYGRVSDKESSGGHPTPKPVELIQTEVLISSTENGSVVDLFGGSGSTLIACEKTNRRCFMMELDPHYCDVIVARWEKYTGQKAELLNG